MSEPSVTMRRDRVRLRPWVFVAFPLLVIMVFTALPAAAGVVMSFFEWSGGGEARLVGLENYRALLVQDPQFLAAARNTVLFAVLTVPPTTVAAFFLAVAVHARWFVGKRIVPALVFMPTVVSIVAVGFIWRWVLDPEAGPVNEAIRVLHLDALTGGEPPLWLGDTPWALAAVIFIQIWRNTGFCVVLYLAALRGIPSSLYDAAAVDGAGPWRTTLSVTWPSVRPMTAFLFITGAIWALQVFDLVWVITGGAEQQWTDVLNTHLYREFAASRLGYAAALGVIVLLLSGAVTVGQFRWFRSEGGGR